MSESNHANKWLKGLKGLEIGGSAHNQFNLDTLNVDYTDAVTGYKEMEQAFCGSMLAVDIVAPAWKIPVEDKSYDFVLSSHVIEHIWDPIEALIEWQRIARQYIYIICPQRDAAPTDAALPVTPLTEIMDRHNSRTKIHQPLGHISIFTLDTFLEMCRHFGFRVVDYLDPDDKVGNGFAVVIAVEP